MDHLGGNEVQRMGLTQDRPAVNAARAQHHPRRRGGRRSLLGALLLASAILSGAAAAYDVATGDGLGLRLDGAARVTALRLGSAQQLLSGPGGFFVADVSGVPCAARNLLPDPGFETPSGRLSAGWSVGADWTLDTTVAHTGRRAMRVNVPGPGKRSSGELAYELPVQPNTPYRVAMWLRTAGSTPCLYLVPMDGRGATRPDYPQICVSHARSQSDWFQLSRVLVTPPFCRRLRVYTCLWQQTGEAWVDDVSVVSLEDDYVTPQKLVTGSVRPIAGGLEQTAVLSDRALRLRATYTAKRDCLDVAAEIEDTAGKDRAVALSFRLPLAATGWTWFDDLQNAQPIEPAVTYGAARDFGDRRTIGLYPFAALGDGRHALGLAVPMDMPRAFRLCFEQGKGFYVNYEFGLSRDAAKLPGKATFRFVIYRTDPEWGFRAAAQRYYALFPQFFTRRLDPQGSAGFMDDLAAVEAPGYCLPVGAIWDYNQRESQAAYRREAVKLFSYTEFAGWWGWALGITPEAAAQQPAPEAAWAHVEELARGDKPSDVAQCILNCAPFDREGKPVLGDSYEAKWGGYNYTCNPDPEIQGPGGDVNRYRLTHEREVTQVAGFGLDGLYLDCVFVSTVDNFRREHFRWADHPLTFDHQTKRPVLPLAFSVYECAQALCDEMHAGGKTVMSNYSVTDYATDPFCIQFIDLIGNEMLWTSATDAKFALQRALAYQKPISMSWQEAKTSWPEADLERELKQAMFYGTFYHVSSLSPALRERWVPLTTRLADAGWEPITAARATAPVMVERFGQARDGDLHFTLRNATASPAAVELQLDVARLGLRQARGTDVWLAADSWSFRRLETRRDAAHWTVAVVVSPNDTVVVRVASPADLARDHLAAVPDLLRKAAKYREALRDAGVAVEGPDYEALRAVVGQAATALQTDGPGAVTLLADAQARLTDPRAPGGDGIHSTWTRRLSEYTARARARLRAASAVLQ
jgi:hypothetical protein